MTAHGKRQALDELAQEIVAATLCPELAASATQLVMGDGNPDASIVFIGEAPGKAEDEQGLPFVGASGRFLNEMLEAAGLVRENVYITNIVKYRPPNNRDPLPEEKTAFWPYLMRQLEIIDPKVIITLGRHSGAAFIPDLTISKDHGKARTVRYHKGAGVSVSDDEQGTATWLLVPLYHPAAALYNGSMRQTLIDDFLSAKKLADDALA